MVPLALAVCVFNMVALVSGLPMPHQAGADVVSASGFDKEQPIPTLGVDPEDAGGGVGTRTVEVAQGVDAPGALQGGVVVALVAANVAMLVLGAAMLWRRCSTTSMTSTTPNAAGPVAGGRADRSP